VAAQGWTPQTVQLAPRAEWGPRTYKKKKKETSGRSGVTNRVESLTERALTAGGMAQHRLHEERAGTHRSGVGTEVNRKFFKEGAARILRSTRDPLMHVSTSACWE